MDWTKFNSYGESKNHAFEVMCNMIFNKRVKLEYKEKINHFAYVNGSGGDGGVEAYCELKDGTVIAIQSKWFLNRLESSQFTQLQNSLDTAIKVRPNISKYIICIPRDLTSKKVVKGGNVTENTEDNNWKEFKSKNEGLYPSVELILWDETAIYQRLTDSECTGIFKHFFEDASVSYNEIKLSFDKVKKGWAHTKYIPDLYSQGYIHETVQRFVGSPEINAKRYQSILAVQNSLLKLIDMYNDLLRIPFPEVEASHMDLIKSDLQIIKEWQTSISKILLFVKDGESDNGYFRDNDFELKYLGKTFKDSSMYYHHYFHYSDFERAQKRFYDAVHDCETMFGNYIDNKMIFVGNPGTGKTVGAVSEIQGMFDERTHLPILVRAKDFRYGDSWKKIIIQTLGLSDTWNETELFAALQASAQIYSNYESDVLVQPQVVIFVDGLDESSDWNFWKEKIKETSAYQVQYTDIKFVFLSRPYVFVDEIYGTELSKNIRRIPLQGDVAVETIFDRYMDVFDIDITNNMWIKYSLQTPLSLKLFSNLYRGKKIGKLSQNSTLITGLLSQKIASMETEFAQKQGYGNKAKVIQNLLVSLASLFAVNYELELKDISTTEVYPDNKIVLDALVFLEQEGFIYSYEKSADPFSLSQTYYSVGMQPLFDYLIAKKVLDSLDKETDKDVDYSEGVLQMLSILLLEEKDELIGNYSEHLTASEDTLFRVQCHGFANASISAVEKYSVHIEKAMLTSPEIFRQIFQFIILPVCKNSNHPLGGRLLNHFLRGFGKPAERDVWWSIPAYLCSTYENDWCCYTEINFVEIEVNLEELDQTYTGMPLALAWRLSTVRESEKRKVRVALTQWGIQHEDEFIKLLKVMLDVNDMQIVEELLNVAYGIALSRTVSDAFLKECAEFLLGTIFSDSGLKKYENIVVRQYVIWIIKAAQNKKITLSTDTCNIYPPYKYDLDMMPACLAALDSSRMGGYGPIDYDLARYVLCDRFDAFFRQRYPKYKYTKEAEDFIRKYENKYSIKIEKIDGLIIGIAYQYLLDCGWNKEIFFSNKEREYSGVDSSILYTYPSATHGSRSSVSSVAEKYTWCARHKMFAVLSNYIPYSDYGYECQYLHDYAGIESFENAYQSYINAIKEVTVAKWYHTDRLAYLDGYQQNPKSINAWMTSEFEMDFEDWICNNDDGWMLYSYTNIPNDKMGIEETVWVSVGLVENRHFDKFISMSSSYFEDRNILLNVSDFQAYSGGGTFCSPQEICAVLKDQETESFIKCSEEIKIYKGLTSCLSSHDTETEKTFTLPSTMLRDNLGIIYGDGYEYECKDGTHVCSFIENGERFRAQQECLFVNSNLFKNNVMDRFTPFWLFRIYRSPSHKAYEIYGNELLHDTDVTFLVWFGENGCNHVKLEEVAPTPKEDRASETDEFDYQEIQRIIEKYSAERSELNVDEEDGEEL